MFDVRCSMFDVSTMKPALLLLLATTAQAQFTTAFLQDEKYWGDGKAEFNIYDAQQTRYGQPRPSEVIHILVREPFSNRELVKAEPGTRSGTYPVIKLNQVLHIPTGLYVYQQMHSAFWRCDSAAVDWAVHADSITVRVTIGPVGDGAKRDDFLLEKAAPHLLREWKQSDGGSLTLRRSLKIDYWNYNKPGDKERALAQP